jgi:hypothetical protein
MSYDLPSRAYHEGYRDRALAFAHWWRTQLEFCHAAVKDYAPAEVARQERLAAYHERKLEELKCL